MFALPLLAFHHHTSEADAFDFGDSAKASASGVPAESPESNLYASSFVSEPAVVQRALAFSIPAERTTDSGHHCAARRFAPG